MPKRTVPKQIKSFSWRIKMDGMRVKGSAQTEFDYGDTIVFENIVFDPVDLRLARRQIKDFLQESMEVILNMQIIPSIQKLVTGQNDIVDMEADALKEAIDYGNKRKEK
jgi:hypothetical protein